MFLEDCFVTLEDLIICEGLRKSILVEFIDSGENTRIKVETVLRVDAAEIQLPIIVEEQEHQKPRSYYCFKWPGWIADLLQLKFTNISMTCPEAIRVACCKVLIHLPREMGYGKLGRKTMENDLPRNGYLGLLGPYPNERMIRVCEKLWRVPPHQLCRNIPVSFTEAYNALEATVKAQLNNIVCSC